MCKHTDEELKALVTAVIAGLDLEESAQGYRRRLLIMDSQIEAHRKLMDELDRKLATFEKALDQFRGLFRINMKVLNLIGAPEKPE